MKYFNYFTSYEFFPHCSDFEVSLCIKSGFLDNLLILFEVLDAFRDYVGKPIIITSTFRDITHNNKVGGSKNSQHLTASAVDFKCPDMPFQALQYTFYDFVEESSLRRYVGQVIFYKQSQFIHLGLRTSSQQTTFTKYDK